MGPISSATNSIYWEKKSRSKVLIASTRSKKERKKKKNAFKSFLTYANIFSLLTWGRHRRKFATTAAVVRSFVTNFTSSFTRYFWSYWKCWNFILHFCLCVVASSSNLSPRCISDATAKSSAYTQSWYIHTHIDSGTVEWNFFYKDNN